jgi:hypothetical protein
MTDEVGTEGMIRDLVAGALAVRYQFDAVKAQEEAVAFIGVLKIAQMEICHFPEGRHDEHDEGALNVAIGTENNRLVVKFGKKIAWMAFDKIGALGFIDTLRRHARTLR